MQVCLFCGGDSRAPDHWQTCDGRQGQIEARDAAMAQVEQHADQTHPGFGSAAETFIVRFLAQQGPTSGELLTNACKAAGIVPHDDRAFGPVYMRLARRGVIVKVGVSVRVKGHLTAGANVWSCG